MDIVLYNNFYEFHFPARLPLEALARFMNMLPLGFQFQEWEDGCWRDVERGPGIYSLHFKTEPNEETPISSQLANYYIRWNARASQGDLPRMALYMAQQLSQELESRVWLVDSYGRTIEEGGFSAAS